MKKLLGFAALALVLLPAASQAHFRLLAPASWIEENQLGDPQKAAPCGGTNADFGKPTYAVTDVKGGTALHVKVQETVYHPGHYRIALAVNSPTELPVDPKAETMTNEKGVVVSVSGAIMNPVAPPVLADGLFQHAAKTDTPFELHASGGPVHGAACREQSGPVHLPPLRGAAHHGRSAQTAGHRLGGGAALSAIRKIGIDIR
jgi:hypothetical protein